MIILMIVLGFFTVLIVILSLRAHLRPITTGKEGMFRETGYAKSDIEKDGTVMMHGELWNAQSINGIIHKGEKVVIVKIEGMKLTVKRSQP